MTCVLCGGSGELRDFSSRDFRGQNITVKICVDAVACIERAKARVPLTLSQKRRALGAK